MSHRSMRLSALALAGSTLAATVALTVPSSISAQATSDVFAPQLVTVDTPTRADKERLQALGLDLTEHAGHDYVEVVLHNVADLDALEAGDFSYDVRIADLVRREAEINQINAEYAASVERSPLPSGRDAYRTLADYNADMTQLAKDRPGIARTFTLKRPSLDGREIMGIEIGADVKRKADGRPTFLLMGVHHAREWPSGELAMEFAVDLVNSYGKNDRITGLLEKSRVLVVPVVNVDGFELSRTDGAMIDFREVDNGSTVTILGTPGNAYKRKNCRIVDGEDTPDGSCRAATTSNGGYGVGTDLNRNYGGFWGGPGASDVFADPTYRGASAFSEPETQNVQDLISSRQVTMMISNHTFSNLILRPNGVHPDTIGFDGHPVGDAPDETALKRLGAEMAEANGYANIHGWELYDTTGTTEDWSYNATGGFGYTFEIGPNEFHPPYPQVVDEYLGAGEYKGMGNREAYLRALEAAVDPSTHSLLTGTAPKGATLRLTKTFQTPTWESSFKDHLETTLLSRGGRFLWHVNPSTRPVVQEKVVETTKETELRSETYEGIAPAPNEHVDHEFTVTQSDVDQADELRISLDWPTPDDYDLEVYRKDGDKLVKVGTSGNFVGEKEQVEMTSFLAGDYVLRVINFASVSPTYTLTAALLHEKVVDTEVIPGKVERWTLTCEKDGKVLQTVKVRVDRGETAPVDLGVCRQKW